MTRRLRNNALLILSALTFVMAVVLVAFWFEAEYYEPAKTELIQTEYFDKDPIYGRGFFSLLGEYVQQRTPVSAAALRGTIQERVQREIFSGNSPVIGFELTRDEKALIEMDREIDRPFNTFRNCLISRGYRGIARQGIQLPWENRKVTVWAVFTFTSPPSFAPVERLTRQYRGYLALIWGGMGLFYYIMLRFLILPVKKVTEAIQTSKEGRPEFIVRPHARLEKLYNRMSRDALLTALTTNLLTDPVGRHRASRPLRMTLEEMFDALSHCITEWFDFDGAWLFDMTWEGRDTLTPGRQFPADRPNAPSGREKLAGVLDVALSRNLRTSWESNAPRIFRCSLPPTPSAPSRLALRDGGHTDPVGGSLFVGGLPLRETEDSARLFVLFKKDVPEGEALRWIESTADLLYRQVIGLVENQILQSRELFRERSEANISLTRNLGHDLTNIIATSKLELMTVGQILRKSPGEWTRDQRTVEIVQESLARILDSTRTLQEIVNLYRAYEHLRSPRYESTDLNRLIEEVTGTFRLSLSTQIGIVYDLSPDAPPLEIEPRLIKLALFNLLSNAQDAIRRLPARRQTGGGAVAGRIFVQTRWDRGRDRVVVEVSDTGTGLRTPEGKLAGEEEIQRVFDLGYSTKPGGQGEGLGLNWVRVILTEFHKGELRAFNRPERGAVFEFTLPRNSRPGE
ncbi:MAG TPA: HAMP domain-containing sensor histidine kinase [Sumerlaeia bacterium]|nr:HAMP domain-containing sensor histidine kinase [Sumerlaeia bacterium]